MNAHSKVITISMIGQVDTGKSGLKGDSKHVWVNHYAAGG